MWYVRERTEMRTGFWWGNLKEGYYLEDLSVDWRIILKWILQKLDGMAWCGSLGLGQGQVVGFCEHGSETTSYIKCGNLSS